MNLKIFFLILIILIEMSMPLNQMLIISNKDNPWKRVSLFPMGSLTNNSWNGYVRSINKDRGCDLSIFLFLCYTHSPSSTARLHITVNFKSFCWAFRIDFIYTTASCFNIITIRRSPCYQLTTYNKYCLGMNIKELNYNSG